MAGELRTRSTSYSSWLATKDVRSLGVNSRFAPWTKRSPAKDKVARELGPALTARWGTTYSVLVTGARIQRRRGWWRGRARNAAPGGTPDVIEEVMVGRRPSALWTQ